MAFTDPHRQSNYMGEWANSGGDSEADAGIPGTGAGQLGIPLANGMWYYDTTNHVFRLRQNGGWVTAGTSTPGWDDVLSVDATTNGNSPTVSDGDTLTIGGGTSGVLDVEGNATLNIKSAGTLAVLTGATATVADAPTSGDDIVNKTYADSIAAGFDPKESCDVATTAQLANFTAAGSGEGKTLTDNSTGVYTIDNVNLTLGMRVLVKDGGPNATPNIDNGIYEVTTAGAVGVSLVLTRATDFDGTPSGEVSSGAFTFIVQGINNGSTGWFVTTTGTITVDTTAIVFSQFAGVGQYTGGQGIDISANQISVDLLAAGGLDFGGGGSDELFVEVGNFAGNGLASDGASPPDLQIDIAGATDLTAITIVGTDEIFLNDASGPDTAGRVLMSQVLAYVNANAQLPNSLTDGAGVADFTFDGSAAQSVALDLYNVQTGGAAGDSDQNNNPLYLDTTNGLNVKIDGSTIGLDSSNNYRLYVPNAAITETQLANSVPGNGLTGGAGSSLSVVAPTAAANCGLKVDANGVYNCVMASGNPNTNTQAGNRGMLYYDTNGGTVWFNTDGTTTGWIML